MDTSPLSPEDIRAAAEAHRELGPEYSDAVVASFLDKVNREVDARVEARLAGMPGTRRTTPGSRHTLLKGVVIGAVATGVPLSVLLVAQQSVSVSQSVASAAPGHHFAGPFAGPFTGPAVHTMHVSSSAGPGLVLLLWLVIITIGIVAALRLRRPPAGRPPSGPR